jgi:hypothetical protein
MIKFRPILFSTPMVLALLNGSKTQTRRTQGLECVNNDNSSKLSIDRPMLDINLNQIGLIFSSEFEEIFVAFKYNVGDALWVRETFYKTKAAELNGAYYYKATTDVGWDLKWKPSIFMPKDACRIFLKVKAIRTERLNDISSSDAQQEGLSENGEGFVERYKTLWQSINGKDSWNKNPFVFVYEFERIEKPLDFI